MGVILQAAFRRRPNVTVPAPSDTPAGDTPWWYDRIAAQARDFRLAGFTALLLPPVLKTNAGAASDADGYGVFDDYDLGSKPQFYSVATRFGTREQLQRCVGVLHSVGIDVYADTVPHQRSGGTDGTYHYLGADGKSPNGRFPKTPGCFVGDPPRVPRDPIAGPASTDFGFGDELAPVNSVPANYVMQGLIDAGDWMTRALGVKGYRIDDVKGMAVSFVQQWANSKSMAGKFAVAEYFDANTDTLNWWVWDSGLGGRCSVFDFTLHFMLEAMCNNGSNWNMSQLDHAGYAGRSPLQAVTFVENPDTDTDGYSSVVWNKMLGYAYILTSEGYPCVYYRDYSTDADCYGLKPLIDNLIWIHENLAFGQTVQRFKDFQCYAFERLGYPNLLVGLNNDMYHGWRTITVQTAFGPNVQLHDYAGRAGDVWTDDNGRVTLGVPPNDYGTGYVCYSRTGYGQPFSTSTRPITQVFEGAADLDIGPAANGGPTLIGRVWCAAGTWLAAEFRPDLTGWDVATTVLLEVVAPDGTVVAHQPWSTQGPQPGASYLQATLDGWHGARLSGSGLPAAGSPFELSVQYTAPQHI